MEENRTHLRPGTILQWIMLGLLILAGGWVLHDFALADAAENAAGPAVESAAADPVDPAGAQPVVVPVTVNIMTPGSAPDAATPAASTTEADQATPVAVNSGRGGASRPGSGSNGAAQPAQADAASTSGGAAYASAQIAASYSWVQVVAADGSIVLVGPDGRMVANTGSASSGGSVALDAANSLIQTGQSGVAVAPGSAAASTSAATGTSDSAAQVSQATAANGATTRSASAVGSLPPTDIASLIGSFPSAWLAGYEDHTLSVSGLDNLVVYDDSNAFINRNGPINANTGDTDSSGVNVVDITGSVIRSGNSGGDDEDSVDEPDEPDEADDVSAVATTADPATGANPVAPPGDDDADDDADQDDEPSAPGPLENGIVVAGDGVDDLSARVTGAGNTAVTDDSNLVTGGTGPVNAQVGDSDTSGLVAMGVHNSVVVSGCAADAGCP